MCRITSKMCNIQINICTQYIFANTSLQILCNIHNTSLQTILCAIQSNSLLELYCAKFQFVWLCAICKQNIVQYFSNTFLCKKKFAIFCEKGAILEMLAIQIFLYNIAYIVQYCEQYWSDLLQVQVCRWCQCSEVQGSGRAGLRLSQCPARALSRRIQVQVTSHGSSLHLQVPGTQGPPPAEQLRRADRASDSESDSGASASQSHCDLNVTVTPTDSVGLWVQARRVRRSTPSANQTCAILCKISSNIVQYCQYVQFIRTCAICTICTISTSILYTKLHAILSNMVNNIMYNFDQYALLLCTISINILCNIAQYCSILYIILLTILLNIACKFAYHIDVHIEHIVHIARVLINCAYCQYYTILLDIAHKIAQVWFADGSASRTRRYPPGGPSPAPGPPKTQWVAPVTATVVVKKPQPDSEFARESRSVNRNFWPGLNDSQSGGHESRVKVRAWPGPRFVTGPCTALGRNLRLRLWSRRGPASSDWRHRVAVSRSQAWPKLESAARSEPWLRTIRVRGSDETIVSGVPKKFK